jgi:hypothetical protein
VVEWAYQNVSRRTFVNAYQGRVSKHDCNFYVIKFIFLCSAKQMETLNLNWCSLGFQFALNLSRIKYMLHSSHAPCNSLIYRCSVLLVLLVILWDLLGVWGLV